MTENKSTDRNKNSDDDLKQIITRVGARGMLNLRQKGAVTYAQDERSCVVFGMPRAAIELNAVDEIQDLVKIAPSVLGRLAAVSA